MIEPPGATLPMKVLFVGLGSRGGAGRYEQLVCAALDELASRGEVQWHGVWRRQYPEYLDSSSPPQRGSLPSFVSRIFVRTRHWRPDVVCFSHVNLARLRPFMRLLGIDVPYVVGALGVEVWERLHWTKRIPLRRAALVLAISEYTRSQVIDVQGVRPDRCRTVHLALEDHWVASAEAGSIVPAQGWSSAPTPSFSLLSVSRLESSARDKGVDWVLRAVAELLPVRPELRYIVVGDGDDLPHLQRLSAELGIERRVQFTGALSHAELLAAYRACDLFVLPTRREGFGLVFLEAMAFRKPIVAMARAGTLDVVTSGEEGILIDDQDELVDAIETVMDDHVSARRMGETGYSAVLGRFSFESFVARLSSVLADTVRAPVTNPQLRTE